MSIELAISSVISILCIALATISYLSKSDKRISRPFAAMTFIAGIWSYITFFEEEKISIVLKPLLVKSDFSMAIVISLFYLIFTLRLAGLDKGIWSKLLASSEIVTCIVVAITALTDLVIKGITGTSTGSIEIHIGSLYYLYVIPVIGNFGLGTMVLIRDYFLSKDSRRTQLLYIILGLAITATFILLTNLILPRIMEVDRLVLRIGLYSISFYLILTTIAITRHGLFDLRVVATEFFVGLILAAILLRLFTSNTLSDILFEGTIFTLSSIFGYFLVKSIQSEIKRREEVEKLAKEKTETLTELEERNKNLATLQTISKLVLNEIEMKPMVQKILNEIPKRLEHSAGALLTLVKDGQLQTYAMSETDVSEKIKNLIGKGVDQFSYPIKKDFNKMHAALFTKDLVESPHLSDFISPPMARPVAATIQTLLGVHSVMAIPLFSGETPLGVLMLTFTVERAHLQDKDMEMIWAVADDVSLAVQRAESYQKLRDANDYLSQLDKMKDEFISMASHELNTPLAAVEGYLSMILDEHMGKVDDKARVYLARAYDSSKRLADLILDLLNVSRIEQGRVKMKFGQANIYDLAESVVRELQIKSDVKKLSLKLEGKKSDKFKTWCDPDRIREIIVNLVGNSIKYTDKGGITLKIEEDSGKIVVRVIDTGRGIAQADMNKLFQKFSQVKREQDEHQGTGLGLYISKNFVELHKGRIWVESEVGKGSTFAFEIPVLKEAPKEVQGAILENVAAPRIETGTKDAPAIIAQSTNSAV